MRKPIDLDMTTKDIIVLMSEGNIGALNVLMDIVNKYPADHIIYLLHLDDMNIRGSQIWVAFKDWAGEDLAKLIAGIESRDREMVEWVSSQAGNCGGHAAVVAGASKLRPAMRREENASNT